MPVFKCAKGKLSGDNFMSEFQSKGSGISEQRENALRIIYCLFLTILSVFWGIQCEDNNVIYEPPPGVIYGTVLDSLSHQPLEAWVALDSTFDTTSI